MKSTLAVATLALATAVAAPACEAQLAPGQALQSPIEHPSMTADYAVTPAQEAAGLPAGNYLLSCSNGHMVGSTLVASCDVGDSTWRTASLPNAMMCDGAIANVGGNLTCTAPVEFGSSAPAQTYDSAAGTSGALVREPVRPAYPYGPVPPGYGTSGPVYQDLSPGQPLGPAPAPAYPQQD